MNVSSTLGLATLLFLARGVQEGHAQTSLQEAYEGAFLIGAALGNQVINQTDSAATAIVTRHFNSITAENVLKPQPINPQPGVYNFGPADRYVEFGEANGMFIVGHTLVWHNQTPTWFFTDADGNPNTREAQIERLRGHIEAVAGRYAGRIDGWDVVNEIFTEDGEYRSSSWTDIIGGEDLVRYAFRFAAQYAPDTELYYNEYNAWRPSKRDGILRLVRMLQAEGIRIDGVGMQGHWGLYYPRTDYLEAAIDSFSALGVKVMITEMDVDVLPGSSYGQLVAGVMNNPQFQHEEFEAYLDPYKEGLPPSVDRELADRYAELFGILYERRDKIGRVTFWGIHDGTSWKNGSPVPGRTNYPLLFDRQRRPKAALDAVLGVPEG
jgi:endo-1,4-beta-xylanase